MSKWSGLLPKSETQSDSFLSDYPKFDGRGVLVAVLDTGIDVGAAGLLITSEGKRKIVDCIDCSGSGDVNMKLCKADAEGFVKVDDNRKLKVGNWSNPSGDYFVGMKSLYELCPKELVTRLKDDRRKIWELKQKACEEKLCLEISNADAAIKADLEVQLTQLIDLAKSYEDPGVLLDCVVFNDGSNWVAVVDDSETGDLSNKNPMASYGIKYEYGTFGASMLQYCVQIYDAGKVLSIVTNAGSHATHVAGIIGANYPDQSDINGIAPGCQMISIKIGDSRLGSMETLPALMRALVVCRNKRVDLINMSYGEPAAYNSGRFASLATELVEKYGIIFVSSAGNDGPALNTVGAPGGTIPALIGVGAYVSQEMAKECYSMYSVDGVGNTNYTWSSRGPSYDGGLGVAICAPGGAITTVPTYTLTRSMLMNGTSMASPNACGGIALLLSALKFNGMYYTPHRIRHIIQRSAKAVTGLEVFSQGSGLLQVHDAYRYAMESSVIKNHLLDIHYDITLPENRRGIYLRDSNEVDRVHEISVSVSPKISLVPSASCFPVLDDVKLNDNINSAHFNQKRVDLEMRFNLKVEYFTEGKNDWIAVPEQWYLVHGGRSFTVRVDPTSLGTGVHYAEIVCYQDGTDVPVFRVPVTVLSPESSSSILSSGGSIHWKNVSFKPGQIKRRFFAIPNGCQWIKVDVKAHDMSVAKRFVIHSLQRLPQVAHRDSEYQKFFSIEGNNEQSFSIPVVPNYTFELCLSQMWNSLYDSVLDITCVFFGLTPNPSEIAYDSASGYCRFDVCSFTRSQVLSPTCSFNTLQNTIAPESSTISLLPERDSLIDQALYGIVLSYRINLTANSKITIRFPMINGLLYEAFVEGCFYMIFTSTKQLVASGDAWPKAHNLSKGSYFVRVMIRHESKSQLESLKELKMYLEVPLERDVSATIYESRTDVLVSGKKVESKRLLLNQSVPCFLACPTYPKNCVVGSKLLGTVSLESDKGTKKFQVSHLITNISSGSVATQESEASLNAEFQMRDAQIKVLTKFVAEKKFEDFKKLSEPIIALYPSHLPLLALSLKVLDTSPQRETRYAEIVAFCDKILSIIDTTALAAFLGKLHESSEAEEVKKNEEVKQIVISTLTVKLLALLDSDLSYDSTLKELKSWVDINKESKKYYDLLIRIERKRGLKGAILKLLNENIAASDSVPLKNYDERIELLKTLGWNHIAEGESRWNYIRFPNSYALF